MALRLNQPYPFYYDSTTRLLRVTAILVVVISLLILLFQPFNINYAEHKFSFPVIALFFGIADSAAFLITILVIRSLFPAYASENSWTILRELSLWAVILLVVGFVNFLLRNLVYANPNNLSVGYLLEEIAHSYLLGLLVATLLTLVNFALLIVSTSNKASGWDELVHRLNESKTEPQSHSVTIRAESEQDEVTFDLADLLYVQVDGNYVEFYLRNDQDQIVRHIKRNTLKEVARQLQPFPNTIRVHRSYLVNLDHVTSVQGNAQGYRLTLTGTTSAIPVSRSYIPAFEAVMNS